MAIRQNAQGIIYGVIYVDHINNTVFNGSDIGKEYGAKGLLEKLTVPEQKPPVAEARKTGLIVGKTEDESVAGEIKNRLKVATF